MNLDLNGVSVNSEDPKKLAEFYQGVFDKKPEWEMGGFIGWKMGSAFFNVGPHSEVKGKNADAPRIMFMLTTEDVKGEYERIMQVEEQSQLQNHIILMKTVMICGLQQ